MDILKANVTLFLLPIRAIVGMLGSLIKAALLQNSGKVVRARMRVSD